MPNSCADALLKYMAASEHLAARYLCHRSEELQAKAFIAKGSHGMPALVAKP